MITFILLFIFAVLGIAFWIVAYTANGRRRAGQAEVARKTAARHEEHRATGLD